MMRFLFLIVAEIDIATRLQIYYVQIYWKYIANALQIQCKYIAIIWQTYCKYIEIFKLGSKYMLHIDYFEINTFRAPLHIFLITSWKFKFDPIFQTVKFQLSDWKIRGQTPKWITGEILFHDPQVTHRISKKKYPKK